VWDYKVALAGKEFQFLQSDLLRQNKNKIGNNLWLGWGFRWQPRHTQRAQEVMRHDIDDLHAPNWFLRLRGVQFDPRKSRGLPWIHGLEEKETDVTVPWDALEGHTGIVATTGSIKTTLFGLVIYQMALRGDTVIVIDPKGDKDLEQICQRTATLLGDPGKYLYMHPAFPKKSVRLDTLKNWDRPTQVASRIKSMLSDSDDNFVNFVWEAVSNITSAMEYVGQRPTYATLLDNIGELANSERLLERVLRRYLQENVTSWEQLIAARKREAETGRLKLRGDLKNHDLIAMIDYFNNEIDPTVKPREISGLIRTVMANREWWGKMIVTLTPLLTKLTSGDLSDLLAPRYDDIEDTRPIFDLKKVIAGNYIFYCGLDSLSDPTIGKALASAVISDASNVAGEIYNYGEIDVRGKAGTRRVHVLIDEWGDAAGAEAAIQVANKGRGAGFVLWIAGQTFADLVDAFGDQAKAKRLWGNLNNLIVGATMDGDTIKLVQERLIMTATKQVSVSQGQGSKTEDTGLEYSGNRSESMSDKETELFPPSLLPNLPNLHYLAIVNRGTVIKGRIPKLIL
jgi:conjugal transfer pilus assembly protein TraD